MNDRFKFRAWDDIGKQFITNLGKIADARCFFHGQIQPGILILEQCTGLKDRNGKLIYEGDIAKLSIENEYGDIIFSGIKPIVYHNDLSLFGFPVTHSGSYKLPIENYPNALFQTDWGIEVIGNIHENPELLES